MYINRRQTIHDAFFMNYSSYIGCCCLVAKLCLTLCNFMDCNLPASSIHGISQARLLEWVAGRSPGDLPNPVLNLHLLLGSLALSHLGNPK